MSASPDVLRRHKQRAIVSAYGISLVSGIWIATQFPGLTEPETLQATMDALRVHWINWVYQTAMLLACFGWLHADARELDIRRPWWLNLGIILVPPLFVPYYLYKTRPPGRRLPPILVFFAILVTSGFAMVIGLSLGVMFSAPPAASAVAI